MKNPLKTKLYYSISEVAEITDLQPYTLRSWEKEFSCLRPHRIHGKNRAYRERDIGIILLIKRLLYEERYTTQGASKKLKNEPDLVHNASSSSFLQQEASKEKEEVPAVSGKDFKDQLSLQPLDEGRSGGEASSGQAAIVLKDGSQEAVERTQNEAVSSLKRAIEGTRKELNEVLLMLG